MERPSRDIYSRGDQGKTYSELKWVNLTLTYHIGPGTRRIDNCLFYYYILRQICFISPLLPPFRLEYLD